MTPPSTLIIPEFYIYENGRGLITEMGVIMWGPGYSLKKMSLDPLDPLVEAIGLSMRPNDTPVPNEQTNLRT